MGSKKFFRLRIGVGRPPHKDVIDYVLEPPSKSQRQQIDDAIMQAHRIVPLILKGEMPKAMQQLHTAEEE